MQNVLYGIGTIVLLCAAFFLLNPPGGQFNVLFAVANTIPLAVSGVLMIAFGVALDHLSAARAANERLVDLLERQLGEVRHV